MRESLVIEKGHFDFLPLTVKAVVCCDRFKAGTVHRQKRLVHFITLSAPTSTLPGAAFGFAFTIKHEMHVWQGLLSQTPPQLTPLPASFIKLSSSTPRFSSRLAAPVAEPAGCFGQYWGTWLQLGTGRWGPTSCFSSANWFHVSFPVVPSLQKAGKQNAHIKARF